MSTIFYIAGSGRTSSTLLSLILSHNTDKSINIGQSRDLLSSLNKNVLCSCGKNIKNCEFWLPLIHELREKIPLHQYHDIQKLMVRFIDDIQTKDWNDLLVIEKIKFDHHSYLDYLKNFLSTLEVLHPGKFFVDSSKIPEIAFAYSLLPLVNLKVVNLIRDPRAIAVSWAKKKNDAKYGLFYADEWIKRQQKIKSWASKSKLSFFTLRYEDLCAHPKNKLLELFKWLNMNEKNLFLSDKSIRIDWLKQHIFPPANEKILREKLSIYEIIESLDWQLSEHSQLVDLVFERVKPYLLEYGYKI